MFRKQLHTTFFSAPSNQTNGQTSVNNTETVGRSDCCNDLGVVACEKLLAPVSLASSVESPPRLTQNESRSRQEQRKKKSKLNLALREKLRRYIRSAKKDKVFIIFFGSARSLSTHSNQQGCNDSWANQIDLSLHTVACELASFLKGIELQDDLRNGVCVTLITPILYAYTAMVQTFQNSLFHAANRFNSESSAANFILVADTNLLGIPKKDAIYDDNSNTTLRHYRKAWSVGQRNEACDIKRVLVSVGTDTDAQLDGGSIFYDDFDLILRAEA